MKSDSVRERHRWIKNLELFAGKISKCGDVNNDKLVVTAGLVALYQDQEMLTRLQEEGEEVGDHLQRLGPQ